MIRKIVFPEDARIVLLYMKRFFFSTIHNTIKELPWVNFLVSIICLRHLQFQNKKSRKVNSKTVLNWSNSMYLFTNVGNTQVVSSWYTLMVSNHYRWFKEMSWFNRLWRNTNAFYRDLVRNYYSVATTRSLKKQKLFFGGVRKILRVINYTMLLSFF